MDSGSGGLEMLQRLFIVRTGRICGGGGADSSQALRKSKENVIQHVLARMCSIPTHRRMPQAIRVRLSYPYKPSSAFKGHPMSSRHIAKKYIAGERNRQ